MDNHSLEGTMVDTQNKYDQYETISFKDRAAKKDKQYVQSDRMHETKSGEKILIEDMGTSHIENTIACFFRSNRKEHKLLIPKYYKELEKRGHFE